MLDLNHCKENDETYLSHFKFAIKIGFRLSLSGVIFIFHAILPIFSIPKGYNIDCIHEYVKKAKNYIDKRTLKRG